jgi:hypothetical protein
MNLTSTTSLKILCRFLSATFLLFSLNGLAHADSAAPGGFLENDEAPAARAQFTASQSGSFLPTRGGFTFPAPYNTHGIRVTTASDCGGNDCVDMIYNYWKNMSNSAGSDTMYVFVGLDQARGGDGPTLFKYVKSTDALTKVGPLFASSSTYARQSGEGWYFSYGMATKLYMQDHSKLLRYDVLSHKFETVFDSTTKYPNTIVTQTNSSNDDDVHSATLEDATSYAKKGCLVYTASSKQFQFFAASGKFDECQIDKGGRYLVIKEKTPADTCASCDEDDVVVDLATGKQQVLMDQDGAGGHSDLGYGYMVASDNWNKQPNAWRVWDLSNIKGSGGMVFHGGIWGSFSPSHVSFANAVSNKPIAQQYVCGGAAVSSTATGDNDIRCFGLDASTGMASEQSLVVAPVMTNLSAAGGDATCPSCTDYGKDPKGNLDPTGQYFFWVSNAGSGRMDAFMVKVPYQVLTGGGSGDSSAVTITSPKQGADITGTLTVTATVSSNLDVAGVTFQIDGADDTTAMAAPFEASWPIGSLSAGSHTLTATATGTDGTTVQSAPVTFTVAGSASNGSTGGGTGAPAAGGGGGGGAVSLFGLLFLGLGFLSRRHSRRG